MTKAEKKIWNVAKNSLIGACVGTVFGAVTTPLSIATCLTAPVSFPLVGMATGIVHDPLKHTGTSALLGLTVGLAMLPTAPVGLVLAPFNALQYGAAGTVIGGIVGMVENDKMDKEEK